MFNVALPATQSREAAKAATAHASAATSTCVGPGLAGPVAGDKKNAARKPASHQRHSGKCRGMQAVLRGKRMKDEDKPRFSALLFWLAKRMLVQGGKPAQVIRATSIDRNFRLLQTKRQEWLLA